MSVGYAGDKLRSSNAAPNFAFDQICHGRFAETLVISAQTLIATLELAPLPHEGGFFRRTWTSAETLPSGRSAGSAIYFLLTTMDFSAVHRLQTDELWLFHTGDPIEHVQLLKGDAGATVNVLGTDLLGLQVPQLVVRGGAWQGARLAPGGKRGWALCTCIMAPGWDDREFQLGDAAALGAEFPLAADWIRLLTR